MKNLKDDPVSEVVRSDSLIQQVMTLELEKSNTKVRSPDYARNNGRMLGRFLLFVRKRYNNPELQFEDLLTPGKFDIVLDCAKWMAGGADEHKSLMTLIRKATNILKGQAISSGDEVLLEKFQTLPIVLDGLESPNEDKLIMEADADQ